MALRWRKGVRWRFGAPISHELRDGADGPILMHVQSIAGGWFFYGMGVNTAGRPIADLSDAKAAAVAHLRAVRKEAVGG